ncbi:hypothetical protein [Spirosoma sp.]|uniref:hypothetical protein n=1 Tax=Spirosoma sp. TaxID=1899569 RepID=UPI00263A1C20|nr:hypothetical protein [Spirosoma sp.]MCX6218374.1 hypothetical protein [Spirosoma sp.]
MTTEELNALQPGTLIYVPSDWFVKDWIYAGQVDNTNYYTLTHPPDPDGEVKNKRPVYFHALDLLESTLDEQAAWLKVLEWIDERKVWIYKTKLPNLHESTTAT